MDALTGLIFATVYILFLAVPITGAVISRRAWKRNGWPEAKLAYHAFVAQPVIAIVAAITFPIVGWLIPNNSVIDTFHALSIIAATASGAATIAIAVALYRLARRAGRQTTPPTSHLASEIPGALS